MTRTFSTAVLAGTALLAVTLGSTAANAATATGQARARILRSITVTNTGTLDFGTIVVGGVGGNITVSTTSARTCDPALTCSATATAGAFNIQASANELVNVTHDATVTLTNPASNTMTANLSASSASVTLNGSGLGGFTVGGVLAVAASQGDGLYTGNYNVNVNYP